ncbi:MAG: extracellular solute-binding protein [Chloroflexi bacterium]|nr:extracellular solute-binding protein [Chloroflexota bacterium]
MQSKVSLRRITRLVACLLLAAAILGCSAPGRAPSGPITLRVAYYPNIVDLKPLLEEYARAHPGLTIETFELTESNYPSMIDEIGKGALDVVRESPEILLGDIRKGNFEPLGGYIESGDWGKFLNDYYTGVWEGLVVDGQQYGVPASLDMYVTYVNRDIFERAGIEPPAAGWTIDDLVEKAAAVNQPDGQPGGDPPVVYGFGTYYLSPDPVIFTYLHDAAIVDDFSRPTQAFLDSEPTMEALRFYSSLVGEHQFSPTAGKLGIYFGYAGIPVAAMQGFCAMWFDLFSKRGVTMDSSGVMQKWDFNWQVLPLPRDAKEVSLGNVDGYYIPATSLHKREAHDLIRWLADQPKAVGSRFPARRSLVQDAWYRAQIGERMADAGNLAAENLVMMPNVYGRYGPQGVLKVLYDALRSMETGDDPTAVLQKAQSEAVAVIQKAQQVEEK